jgi:outer membrane protein insertion porin family
MMHVWFRALVVVILFVGIASPVRAQEQESVTGQTVVGVEFEVEGQGGPESLAALSAVQVGEPLDLDDVRTTIARLDGLGLYDQISARAVPVPGGIVIAFVLEPRHPVTALQITGNTGIPARELEQRVRQRYGGVPTTARVSAVESTVVQLLEDEGYLAAEVTSRTELRHAPDAATLILDVDAGAQSVIRSIEVRGNSPRSSHDIVRATGTTVGSPFRRREIQRAITAIEEDLRRGGYYEAQLTLQAESAAEGVDVVINVDVGPRVELRVEPRGALPGAIDTLIPIRQQGSADQDLLEDSRARIEAALRADGYWRARAPFTRRVEENGSLLIITFSIDRGPRYYVSYVDVPDALSLPAQQIRNLIGLTNGDVFDEARFLAGLSRVADMYRMAGYYRMRAEPTYEEVPGDGTPGRAMVVLHPTITEGPAGRVAVVNVSSGEAPRVPEADVRQAMTSRVGDAYVEQRAVSDRAAISRLYADRGFPDANVEVVPSFSQDGRDVTLDVRINEGPQVFIGDITVVGNEHVSTAAILDELALERGQPAGATLIENARTRLVEMGVFRRVNVALAGRRPGETQGHVIVNVVEAPGTTVGIGGGLEAGIFPRRTSAGTEDRLEFAPRGFFEVSRRNLGGRNRVLSFFSRASLKRDLGSDDEPLDPDDGRGFAFAEYRVTGTYRERRAFRSDTDFLIGVSSEQARRTNFNFVRQLANAEVLRELGPTVSVSGRYALEFTRLFDVRIAESDRPLIDRLFPQVRLSILSTGVSWDRRDDPITPASGALVTGDAELAARGIGSEVGYVKVFLQGAAFRRLDSAASTVLAGRALLGLAQGLPRTVETELSDGSVVEETVRDLPASQRFFAGGSTTVRGFQLDRLGTPAIIDPNGLSRGGNGLVVLNLELRRRVGRLFGRDMGVVAFADAGNVFNRASDVRLSELRPTSGFGIRYNSPLGPLRLDFGFKLDRREMNGTRERGWEYHLSIGEAF